jgi:hypothetical protein
MNLFREIEGLRGENLTSAILRILMLRSQDVKDMFVDMISDQSQQGIVMSESRFVCEKELTTQDEDKGGGRIDLYIELDDAVVGIENKFDAGFQSGQPEKYLGFLKDRASLPGKRISRDQSQRVFLVILAPKKRRQDGEIERLFEGEDSSTYVFIAWERLRDGLEKLKSQLDLHTGAIAEFFIDYINDRLVFLPNFKRLVPHFTNRFDANGTDTQRLLVSRLWRFFEAAGVGGRISQGEDWVGYYFLDGRGWYGFQDISRVVNPTGNQKAIFIIGCKDEVNVDELLMSSIEVNDAFAKYWWQIKLDESWSDPEKWKRAIAPFAEIHLQD